jgi:hypothetical protein
MAIKVNGTTVIDDNRNLVNIVSGAGSSTTAGAVGTYGWMEMISPNTTIVGTPAYRYFGAGTTFAGSALRWAMPSNSSDSSTSPTVSGTWQHMAYGSGAYDRHSSLFVRIS